MELIILIGIPASGKSTFYQQQFSDTHVRINQDMLRTRNRVDRLFDFCLTTEQPCVLDNTNVVAKQRGKFIAAAKENRFKVKGYYFQASKEICVARNEERSGENKVPLVAIYSKLKELERPSFEEGFDELYYVKINGGFEVSPWRDDPDS